MTGTRRREPFRRAPWISRANADSRRQIRSLMDKRSPTGKNARLWAGIAAEVKLAGGEKPSGCDLCPPRATTAHVIALATTPAGCPRRLDNLRAIQYRAAVSQARSR